MRRKILKAALKDRKLQSDLIAICASDILFWINLFCWTYDPRKPNPNRPWVTYPFQDEALLDIQKSYGVEDVAAKKSRDMGASWMFLTVCQHRWQFHDSQSALFVSRNVDYVDGDDKSLFWKVDYQLARLPLWMVPPMERTQMRLLNLANGSLITGETTTGNVGRGGRFTVVLIDEFAAFDVKEGYKALASTRDATKCRFFNSTPQGGGNAFYDVVHSPHTKILTLHWSSHPEKNIGLWTDENGKQRSPWYDEQCKRAKTPIEIPQELDIDFLGSDFQFFDAMMIDQLVRKEAWTPTMVGELDYDEEGGHRGFIRKDRGHLRLWMPLEDGSPPPRDRDYVVGADISSGTGASNSVLAVYETVGGVKVAEYVNSKIRPEEFATLTVALCHWFRGKSGYGAKLIWESPGPGRNFGDRVIDLGYRNIYWRTNETKIARKPTDIPGWFPSKDAKRAIYNDYHAALKEGRIINRSADALNEAKQIVHHENGWIAHSRVDSSLDPSGARENHGDRPTADALACKLLIEVLGGIIRTNVQRIIPPNSMAGRKLERDRLKAQEALW